MTKMVLTAGSEVNVILSNAGEPMGIKAVEPQNH